MGLVVPGVGTEQSPAWATDLNSSLDIIDAHDHSPGKGVQVTPAGINISSDLSFNGNNQTLIRSSRYAPQASPLSGSLDLGCTYVSGVDLYYNDENGNQIQITKNGSIAGTSGSIANLTSPASASYVSGSQTFVWQSNTNTAAAMDNGPVTIRKLTASSPGITLEAPSSISGNYTLTLPPAPPSVNSVLVMDNSGNVTTTAVPDSLTITNTITTTSGDINATSGTITGNQIVSNNNVNAGALVRAGTAVYPRGGSNAYLASLGDNILLAGNPNTADERAIVTAAAAGYAHIISGTVNQSATILAGSGFTASVVGTTVSSTTILITFSSAFVNTPVVTCGSVISSASVINSENSGIANGTASSSSVQLIIGGNGGGTVAVNFIAVGERST